MNQLVSDHLEKAARGLREHYAVAAQMKLWWLVESFVLLELTFCHRKSDVCSKDNFCFQSAIFLKKDVYFQNT